MVEPVVYYLERFIGGGEVPRIDIKWLWLLEEEADAYIVSSSCGRAFRTGKKNGWSGEFYRTFTEAEVGRAELVRAGG